LLPLVLENNGEYYCELTGLCNVVMSETATVEVLPWTQQITFGGAADGMSTYLSLEGHETATDDLASIFDPIIGDVSLVKFRNPVQSWSPLNASFGFPEEAGAEVQLNSNGGTVEVKGYPILGTVADLTSGKNYMPVYASYDVDAYDVLNPINDDISVVYAIDYSGYWWPDFSYFTLSTLKSGNAYVAVMKNASSVDYDVPAMDAAQGYADVPRNKTNWNDLTLTVFQHQVMLAPEATSELQEGDVVGIFNEYGNITGMVEITNPNEAAAIKTIGDNPMTARSEGFIDGEVMTVKVWRNGEEMVAYVEFDENMPNTSVFEEGGISAISSLKLGATSVVELSADLQAVLYPNPATDFVTIETNFEIENIKVVNYVGQVVLSQDVNGMNLQINTSDYRSGMYFVQMENADGVVITKRLTIK
jgi:hypothetical protein